MNVSAPFVVNPVATTLLTIGLILLGVVAYILLPIAGVPQVDIPTIRVTANLPGANAETMATSVATPLERQFRPRSPLQAAICRKRLRRPHSMRKPIPPTSN
jgi:multidrug efflux pump subunit AcrB